MALVLPILLAFASGIPEVSTAVARLSTASLRHHEVLRIDRDFGMAKWELALDSWTPVEPGGSIAELRLWWANADDADRRKPFSPYLRRYIEFGHQRGDDGALTVQLAGDGKRYSFVVELGDSGTPEVFATVIRGDGTEVPRCRCERGRLVARRILGLPIGIEALQMRCTDVSGQRHEGVVPHVPHADDRRYQPE